MWFVYGFYYGLLWFFRNDKWRVVEKIVLLDLLVLKRFNLLFEVCRVVIELWWVVDWLLVNVIFGCDFWILGFLILVILLGFDIVFGLVCLVIGCCIFEVELLFIGVDVCVVFLVVVIISKLR